MIKSTKNYTTQFQTYLEPWRPKKSVILGWFGLLNSSRFTFDIDFLGLLLGLVAGLGNLHFGKDFWAFAGLLSGFLVEMGSVSFCKDLGAFAGLLSGFLVDMGLVSFLVSSSGSGVSLLSSNWFKVSFKTGDAWTGVEPWLFRWSFLAILRNNGVLSSSLDIDFGLPGVWGVCGLSRSRSWYSLRVSRIWLLLLLGIWKTS